jgi:predicted Zn-dependent peptidase
LFGSIEVAQQTMAVDNSERVTCNDRLRTVQVDGSMQGSVRMAIPTIGPTHPDYCDLSLAVTALGGYFGSRLISNVREDKGYTYGIQAMMTGARDYGLMAIASEADNTYVIPLIQETISEIAQLQSKIASAEEIERMRNYAMSQIIALLDSPFSVMDYYEMMHCDNLPADMFHRNMKSIENITGERIAEVAAQYLQPDKIKIVVAGDVDTHPVHADDIFC